MAARDRIAAVPKRIRWLGLSMPKYNPQKCPFLCDMRLTHGSLIPTCPQIKWYLDRFSRFSTAHARDRQTHRPRYSGSNKPHSHALHALRPNNNRKSVTRGRTDHFTDCSCLIRCELCRSWFFQLHFTFSRKKETVSFRDLEHWHMTLTYQNNLYMVESFDPI